MISLSYLIPISLLLGAAGLAAFLWSLKSGQYEDLDGAAERILFDDDNPVRRDDIDTPTKQTKADASEAEARSGICRLSNRSAAPENGN